MKERPILFKGEMVRAIMEGRKTQTRRIVKNTDLIETIEDGIPYYQDEYGDYHKTESACPYGKIGSLLWVRETFNSDWCDHVIYKADGGSAISAGYDSEPKWKPSIHMPRIASRINLEITNIRVERLQDITEEESQAEGVSSKGEFKLLWCAINGFDSWNENPFVWVIEFKKV